MYAVEKMTLTAMALVVLLVACGKKDEPGSIDATGKLVGEGEVTIPQLEVIATANPCIVAIKNEGKVKVRGSDVPIETRYVNVQQINNIIVYPGNERFFGINGGRVYTLNPQQVVDAIIETTKDCH